jgi:hypothetical protein
MAAVTKTATVTNDAWVLLSSSNCSVTAANNGASLIFAAALPASTVNVDDGIVISGNRSNDDNALLGVNNTQGGNCYGRSLPSYPTTKLIVTEY